MVKDVKIFIGLKKTCLGVLEREDRDKNNATGLKEGGGIEMSTTVLHSRAAPSLLIYLPVVIRHHSFHRLIIHRRIHPMLFQWGWRNRRVDPTAKNVRV